MIIKNLTVNELKLRDLYLRKLALGELEGPLTGYPSIDKKWLKYYTEEQIMSFSIPQMTMYQYMIKKNKEHLDDNAICYFDKNITYREFDELINKCAKSFLKNGISVGDKVTICMPNTPEAIITVYALNKIGAVANMIHPLSSQEEIKNFVNEVDSKMIITSDIAYGNVLKIADETNLEKIVVASTAESMPLMTKALYKIARENYKIVSDRRKISWKQFINFGNLGIDDIFSEVPYEKNRLAIIIHTGGTTGIPKGVELTNENFNSMVEQFFKNADNFSRGDKMLTIMPVFHGFGLCSSIHLPLSVGVTTILIPKLDKNYDKIITKHKPNHIIGVPTLFKSIMNNSKLKDTDFSFLKYVVSGGDFVTDSFENKINTFLIDHGSNAELSKGYGLSEAVAGVTFSYGNYNVVGSNGIPMVATNMKIVKPGTDEELKEGEVGEVCVYGPTVMQGYYNNEEETKNTLINGWLHTGDLGRFDENGIFYFAQRKGNLIISSGVNVYPSNIEQVIEMHPNVSACAVIGISHPYKMQVPKAYIELKHGCVPTEKLEQEIIDLCKKYLNKYSIPHSLEFTDIPKTKLGKVSHSMLQEREKIKFKKR